MFQRSKNRQVTRFTTLIFPINCCVRITISLTVYSMVMFCHRYLGSDCKNFKTFVFLAVYYLSDSDVSSYSTAIKVQPFLKSSLHNVKQLSLILSHFITGLQIHHRAKDKMARLRQTYNNVQVCINYKLHVHEHVHVGTPDFRVHMDDFYRIASKILFLCWQ